MQVVPSFDDPPAVYSSTGDEPDTSPLDSQPAAVPSTMVFDPHMAQASRPEPDTVSSLAQEVHVTDDGEVRV